MSIVTLNNRALKDATAVGTTTGLGNLVFISRSTSSSSSSLSITSGIDSTYKEYIFILNNIHSANDDVMFQFNGSDDTSSHSFDITKTTTFFTAEHSESGSEYFSYSTGGDLAQSTGYQRIFNGIGNVNDESCAGILHLFDPSNTTFAKHFLGTFTGNRQANSNGVYYLGGYFNTTSAITALDFKVDSGNIDSGTIDMYGVS